MRTAKVPLCLALLALLACPIGASAQKYPEKPIRMIVAFPTGASQILALLLADKLRDAVGQGVVPDFRPGAGGNVAHELAAKAPSDGYTLLLTSGSITISPSLYPKLAYDTFRDFTPISNLASVPNVMVVHPSVPAKTLGELVRLARSMPGKLNYGSGGFGSGSQLGSELFMSLAKVRITHIPYKGATLAITELIGGQIVLYASSMPPALPLINGGKLKALGVTTAKRLAPLPNVMTVAESGVPGYEAVNWYGVFVPAGASKEIIAKLHNDIVRVLKQPDVKDRFAGEGGDIIADTPEQFAAFVSKEIPKWSKVVKDASVKVD